MHDLLKNQIRQFFGDPGTVPESLWPLLEAVNRVYRQWDAERELIGRSLDRSEGRGSAEPPREDLFRAMADSSPILIWMTDPAGLRTYFNQTWLSFTGRTLEQEAGNGWVDGIHPEDLNGFIQKFRPAFEARQGFLQEYRLRRFDGQYRWVLAQAVPMQGPQGEFLGYVGCCIDIADRKRAEEKARRSEERFDLLARATNDAVWDWNLLTGDFWWNDGIRTLFGYLPAEVSHDAAWRYEKIHPDDRARVMATIQTVIDGGGELWSGEYRFRREDGSYATIYDRGYIMRDASRRAMRMIGAMADVTERRRYEAIALQGEKMQAVGQLAAGVAHEINNPLGVILGFAQGAIRRLEPGSPFDMPLRNIEREAQRCRALVQDLLTFSRPAGFRNELFELNQTVEGALSLVQAQAKVKRVDVRREFAGNLPRLTANKNQLQQVVINLATNAFDAMPDGGTLTVSTFYEQNEAGDWITLRVADTGAGIPADIQGKIFEPFFTTKPVGQGTGLGLSLVYDAVRKHAGSIEVQSRPGCTEFTIRFPAGRPSEEGAVRAVPAPGEPL